MAHAVMVVIVCLSQNTCTENFGRDNGRSVVVKFKKSGYVE